MPAAENLPVSNGQSGGGTLWAVAKKASAKVPKMVRGTVMTHRRRCGKANCRCAEGEALHEQVILSYSEQSRARSVSLPGELVEPVRAATARYRRPARGWRRRRTPASRHWWPGSGGRSRQRLSGIGAALLEPRRIPRW